MRRGEPDPCMHAPPLGGYTHKNSVNVVEHPPPYAINGKQKSHCNLSDCIHSSFLAAQCIDPLWHLARFRSRGTSPQSIHTMHFVISVEGTANT